eukprot:gene7195-5055_t
MLRLAQRLLIAQQAASRPMPSTKEPWENLQGLLVSAKPIQPRSVFEDIPLTLGHLTEKVSESSYTIRIKKLSPTANAGKWRETDAAPPLALPLGHRVRVFYGSSLEEGMTMEGLIVKVNGNATYTMLMENNEIELSVSANNIYKREGHSKVVLNPKLDALVGWINSCIRDHRDVMAASLILFKRGWRVETMYLLEKADIHVMTFIPKIQREAVMEKAQWERDHHGVVRLLHRERVKDRDFRYSLAKYKGTISCIAGICVVSYVFTANFRAYRKQQRSYQLKLAARTVARMHQAALDEYMHVERTDEEREIREALQQLDTTRPRALVITGFAGCGKSSVCRRAVQQEKIPGVFVDLRSSEDTLRSVVRSIGVANVDVCGDLLDFTAEVLQLVANRDHIPVLVLKLREGNDLEKVYKEAISLVSDHRACHIIFEVPLESLTPAHMTLPRVDFYVTPNFTRAQAFGYTQHLIEPLDLFYFLETVGTNSNDLDELYAAVRQRGVDAVAYTSLKLMKAIRRVRAATVKRQDVQDALYRLAERPFEAGLSEEYAEELSQLHDPILKELVLYDPVEDRWLFAHKVLHTAARCCMPLPNSDFERSTNLSFNQSSKLYCFRFMRSSMLLRPGRALLAATPRLHQQAIPAPSCTSSAAMPSLAPDQFKDVVAAAYFENPLIGLGVHHFTLGKFTKKLSEEEYVVEMSDVHLSPIAEVNSRVFLKVGRTAQFSGRIISGIVGKINSNGSLGVLLDNNSYESQVQPGDVYLVEGRSKFTLSKDYAGMMEWIRDAGVRRRADQERICSLLYQRGWRVDRLYLLEGPDIHCMTYVKKSVRMSVLEKAEWQRAHHTEMRTLLREKVKERELRYFVQKYSGFVSANWAGLGVLSVFLWQFKNFRKSQRSFQLKHAVRTLVESEKHNTVEQNQFVERPEEAHWARQIIQCMDITRPRIAVVTGFRGCGKSILFRSAIHEEKKPVLFVEVRDKEDTLACVLRSLKVPSVESCADPLDFITDTFRAVGKKLGQAPTLVIVLREGSELSRVYNESVVLACDRNLCHLIFEVALEDLTPANTILPRTDFYCVPNFNKHQAMQYSQHRVDPVAMTHFIQVVGTNSDDTDDLLSAMHHRKVLPTDYTNQKLAKAVRLIQSTAGTDLALMAALRQLAKEKFNAGLRVAADTMTLGDEALKDIVMHDPLMDRWLFTRQVLHTARNFGLLRLKHGHRFCSTSFSACIRPNQKPTYYSPDTHCSGLKYRLSQLEERSSDEVDFCFAPFASRIVVRIRMLFFRGSTRMPAHMPLSSLPLRYLYSISLWLIALSGRMLQISSKFRSVAAAEAAVAARSHFTQPGLDGLRVAAYPSTQGTLEEDARGLLNQAIAIGNVVAQLSEKVVAVEFRQSSLAPFIEVGSRVYVSYGHQTEGTKTILVGGLIVLVNRNGTFGVLLDNNQMDLAVPRDKIALSEGRCKFLDNRRYTQVAEWVRSAGVEAEADIHSTACVLFVRGWRADRLYLLESGDISQLTHLTKSVRMSIMEKAEWQRDHHRQMRSIYKERVKEKDKRYLFSKYAGILSASVAFCGAFSLFGWNYKNYLKQQRSYQMRFAVKALSRQVPEEAIGSKYVSRAAQEQWIRQILRRLDTSHPRIVVFTGYFGCGKSALMRACLASEAMNAVFVDVRNKEDSLRSVIKALGVPHVDACGDPLDFITEACEKAASYTGKTPVIVLKLRDEDNLSRVYNEAVTLACDRRMCHLVIEVPIEALSFSNTALPHLDFYTVPNFTQAQGYQYLQHRVDPLDMEQFHEVIGTNSNDLDELLAALQQGSVTPTEYAQQKVQKAMRQLRMSWSSSPALKDALKRLSAFPFEEGEHEGVDEASLRSEALRDIVIYNPVKDTWLFSSKVFHTATRCSL